MSFPRKREYIPTHFSSLVCLALSIFPLFAMAPAFAANPPFDYSASYQTGLSTTLDDILGQVDTYDFSQSRFRFAGPVQPSLATTLDLVFSQRNYDTLSDRTNHYWQLSNGWDWQVLDAPDRRLSLDWDLRYQDRYYLDASDDFRRWGGGVGASYARLDPTTDKVQNQLNFNLDYQNWQYYNSSVIPASAVVPPPSVTPASFVIPASSVIPTSFVIPAKAGIQSSAPSPSSQSDFSAKIAVRQLLFWEEVMADGFMRLDRVAKTSGIRDHAQGKIGLTYNPIAGAPLIPGTSLAPGFLDILRLGYKAGWAQTLDQDETDLDYDYDFREFAASADFKLWPKITAGLNFGSSRRVYDEARYTSDGYDVSLSLKYEPVYHKNYYSLSAGWAQMDYPDAPDLTRRVPSLDLAAVFSFDPDWRLKLGGRWAQYSYPDGPDRNCRTYNASAELSKKLDLSAQLPLDLSLGYSFTYKDSSPQPSERLGRLSLRLAGSF